MRLARCWFVNQKEGVVIFNAYGDDLSTFAEILAHHLQAKWVKAYLEWHGGTDSLYINGERGILLFPPTEKHSPTNTSITIHGLRDGSCGACGCEQYDDDLHEYEGYEFCIGCGSHCDWCGCNIPHHDTGPGSWHLGVYRTDAGRRYCRKCAGNKGCYEHAEEEAEAA